MLTEKQRKLESDVLHLEQAFLEQNGTREGEVDGGAFCDAGVQGWAEHSVPVSPQPFLKWC